MSMTDMGRDHPDLDDMFALAQRNGGLPSADLMARVLADAEDVLRVKAAPDPSAVEVVRVGRWSLLMQALGGWGGVGGLLTASFAGLWLGLAGVGGDIGLWSGTNTTAIDLAPDAYALLAVEE